MRSGKTSFPQQFFLSQSERVHTEITQSRKKDHARDASQPSGCPGRKPPQFEELHRCSHPQSCPGFRWRNLQRQQDFFRYIQYNRIHFPQPPCRGRDLSCQIRHDLISCILIRLQYTPIKSPEGIAPSRLLFPILCNVTPTSPITSFPGEPSSSQTTASYGRR